MTTIQPAITATVSGNTAGLGWGWGGNSAFLDSCEIKVDHGAGYALLTIETTPNHTDT